MIQSEIALSAHVSCHSFLQSWLVLIIWQCPLCLFVDLVPSVAVLVLRTLAKVWLCHVPGSVVDFRQGDKLVSGLCFWVGNWSLIHLILILWLQDVGS